MTQNIPAEIIFDIKVDKDQNIIVTGIFSGNVFITIKYSNNSVFIWQYLYTGYTGPTIDPKKMLVDNETGEFYILVKSSVNTGFKVICLSRSGTLNWTAEVDVAAAYPYRVIKDRFNNIYVTGYKYSSVQKLLIEKYSPITTGIHQSFSETPKNYSLSQNYPNPFNPVTRIDYSIPLLGFVSIKVYDALGRFLKNLLMSLNNPGIIQFLTYASGLYYYSINTNNFSETKKMLLIK